MSDDISTAWQPKIDDNRYIEVVPRVVPSVGIQDEPTRCYRINLQWAVYVAGAMSELLNIQSWVGVQDEQHTAIQQLLTMLIGEECGADMDCNDVIDCIENDGNYNALAGAIFTQSIGNTQSYYDDLENNVYDTTPQSVGPNVPVGAPTGSDLDALCYAVQLWLELYAASKQAQIQQKNLLNIAWDRLRAAGNAAIGFFRDVFSPVYNFQIYDCFVNDSEALSALSDTSAIETLACKIYQMLDNDALSENLFNDAITDIATAGIAGNVGKLACLLSNDNDLQIYLSFLETYNRTLQMVIDEEAVPACACPDGWCIEIFPHIDIKAGQINVGTISGTGLEGELITALGQGDIREVPNLTLNRYYAGIVLDFGEVYDCDGMEIIVDYTFSGELGGNDQLRTYWDTDLIGNGSLLGQLIISATGSFTWTRSAGLVGDFRYLYIDARGTEPVTINRVYIASDGPLPLAIVSDGECL